MGISLQPDERMDDLLTHHLKIIQSSQVFSFSMDAVLLARFCTVPRKGSALDLCTGNGVIPLLLTTRSTAKITGVEIQPRLAHMADRSVRYNRLEQQVQVLQADLRTVHETIGMGKFDLVTVNPPYLPALSGDQNMNPHMAAARHEIYCTLEDVIAASSRLVRTGGKVAIVHRPARLVDLFVLLRKYRLEPKRLRFVHPRKDQEANMILVEAARDGKPELRLLPPLIVYNADGKYEQELADIYFGHATELTDEASCAEKVGEKL